ncbi:MAG: M15 family metallopeptidase [Bacteroidota bacterium]
MKLDITRYSLFFLILFSCSQRTPEAHIKEQAEIDTLPEILVEDTLPKEPPVREMSELEKRLIDQGLVNVLDIDSSFVIDVKYATEDNFMGRVLYGEYDQCYLQPEAAFKLKKAHDVLKRGHPDLRFVLYDCVRPRSVQVEMWELVKGTEQQQYVASPKSGSIHNFGAAVDLSLIHVDTGLVDMGTPYDYFGRKAQPRYENAFVQEGVLRNEQVRNRRILRAAMLEAEFSGILSEWWHFNAFPNEYVKSTFEIVE